VQGPFAAAGVSSRRKRCALENKVESSAQLQTRSRNAAAEKLLSTFGFSAVTLLDNPLASANRCEWNYW
jgi:hypothetical protein